MFLIKDIYFLDKMCVGKVCFKDKKGEIILEECGGYFYIFMKRIVFFLKLIFL